MIVGILAAGEAKRFGKCKQTTEFNGKALLSHVLDAVPKSLDRFVVTGAHRQEVNQLLKFHDVPEVFNKNYSQGMATSLQVAADYALQSEQSLLVTLGDLPWVTTEDYQQLIQAFEERPIFAKFSGHIGPPAVFPVSFLQKIVEMKPACGAKTLVQNPETVLMANAGKDVDFPEDLMLLK